MLKLHTLAEWMHGFLDPERPYGLPEDVYNDCLLYTSDAADEL